MVISCIISRSRLLVAIEQSEPILRRCHLWLGQLWIWSGMAFFTKCWWSIDEIYRTLKVAYFKHNLIVCTFDIFIVALGRTIFYRLKQFSILWSQVNKWRSLFMCFHQDWIHTRKINNLTPMCDAWNCSTHYSKQFDTINVKVDRTFSFVFWFSLFTFLSKSRSKPCYRHQICWISVFCCGYYEICWRVLIQKDFSFFFCERQLFCPHTFPHFILLTDLRGNGEKSSAPYVVRATPLATALW